MMKTMLQSSDILLRDLDNLQFRYNQENRKVDFNLAKHFYNKGDNQ